jgi:lactate dehydrogenase-like 2-hydroxyacid dehydrogenase
LREVWIAGAELDVYEEEPRVHPELLECRNAVLAPRVASAARETRLRMALMASRTPWRCWKVGGRRTP